VSESLRCACGTEVRPLEQIWLKGAHPREGRYEAALSESHNLVEHTPERCRDAALSRLRSVERFLSESNSWEKRVRLAWFALTGEELRA
jgi:hypothetical protein